jgi:hypothetical protein
LSSACDASFTPGVTLLFASVRLEAFNEHSLKTTNF